MTALPDHVELRFRAPISDEGVSVDVVNESHQEWSAGPPTVDGTLLSLPTDAGAPDGRYEIRWAVTSADGAPLSGTVHFFVGDVAPADSLLDRVLTASDALWIGLVAAAVIGLLLVWIAFGLFAVYGRPPALRHSTIPPSSPSHTGQTPTRSGHGGHASPS